MSPDELNAAANALVTATQGAAVSSGQNIEANAAALAPGLANGSNIPGGRNFQMNVAPVVPVLTAQFVTDAKQGALRSAVRDAIYSAQGTYDDAKAGYQTRQRTFQQKQAQRARDRQAEEDRRYSASVAAQSALSRGGGAGVGGVNVSENNKQFIGNNDLRGRLAYLASKGDNNAKVALNYVGNDGKYSLSPSDPRYKQAVGALDAVGAVNVYKAPVVNQSKPRQVSPIANPNAQFPLNLKLR